MEKDYTTLRIDLETYTRLKKLAEENGRSLIGQIRFMLNATETLPHPPDATPVPVIYIEA